jgi:PAS domain S-box-containing protein
MMMLSSLAFLQNGGEMGSRIRAHDWSATMLGSPEGWPAALKMVVRLMLTASQPIQVFWGADAICLYNDAARRLLGDEWDSAPVGLPARDTLQETWLRVGPLVEGVLRGGDGVTRQDEPLTITDSDRPEDQFWTFSLSPVADEGAEQVGGVLAVWTETTTHVASTRRISEENAHRYSLFERLPAFIGVLRGPEHVYEYVNQSYERFVGRGDLVGQPVRAQFPDLEGQGFFEMLDGVYATGKPVVLQSVPIRFAGEDRFMDLRYDPTYDDSGAVNGIFVSGHDLTDRVLAEQRRQVLAELSERLRDLTAPDEIAFVASELLGTIMRVCRAGYGTVDEAGEILCVDRNWTAHGVDPLPSTLRLADYGPVVAKLRAGAVVAISDVEDDIDARQLVAAYLQRRTRSFVCAPVIEQGRLVALLYVDHVDARRWSDEDVAFIREFAERTRTAVERGRSDLALRSLTASLEQQVEQRTNERDRLWETSEDLLATATYDGRLLRVSPSWTRCLGYDEATLLSGSVMRLIHPDDVADVTRYLLDMVESARPVRYECRLITQDGSDRWIAWSLVPEIAFERIQAVGRDVTADRTAEHARQVLEDQLRQSQKMEAVGQLTGGIAHDFNNMVLGITGSLQIAMRRLDNGRADEIGTFLGRAKAAADRAAALTHRLLAFARRQPLRPRSTDVAVMITSLADLFRGTLGERVTLDIVPEDALWPCLCDPNQLESSLLNLIINARDAMPDGGMLTIKTRNLDQRAGGVGGSVELDPGQYVCISVRDTGLGMSAETLSRAFDPFFTTKPAGKGTGLGLSMVYGFARQSCGAVLLESWEGEGTEITVFLPRSLQEPISKHDESSLERPVQDGDGKTILVIEDDTTVRNVVIDELMEQGYRALPAPDGEAGLALLRSAIQIDMLVTDIGLPGQTGHEIAKAARQARPHIPILFMTGYAEKVAPTADLLVAGTELITKPFALDEFVQTVSTMMEGRGGRPR